MALLPEGIDRYFTAVDRALLAVDSVYKPGSGPWGGRHDIVYSVVNEYIERLRRTFRCLHLYCQIGDSFKIDINESGYPIFKHILQIQDDIGRVPEKLRELDTADHIRQNMLDAILRFKRAPAAEQRAMAERLYFETLAEGNLLLQRSTPRTIRWSINRRTGRPFYVVRWAMYDGVANLPLVYMAVIEDSSKEAEPPPPREALRSLGKGQKRKHWRGLPNETMRDEFIAFAASQSAYSLNLTSIATALDRDFEHLHPKQLRRFVLGPLYSGGLTNQNEKIQGVLDGVIDKRTSWLLTWAMQEVHSVEEKPARWGIWGGTQAQEVFHVNTDDIECVQNGVSHMEKHAVVPHAAYQAAYAVAGGAKIFDGYQSHIVSEDNVLLHI